MWCALALDITAHTHTHTNKQISKTKSYTRNKQCTDNKISSTRKYFIDALNPLNEFIETSCICWKWCLYTVLNNLMKHTNIYSYLNLTKWNERTRIKMGRNFSSLLKTRSSSGNSNGRTHILLMYNWHTHSKQFLVFDLVWRIKNTSGHLKYKSFLLTVCLFRSFHSFIFFNYKNKIACVFWLIYISSMLHLHH